MSWNGWVTSIATDREALASLNVGALVFQKRKGIATMLSQLAFILAVTTGPVLLLGIVETLLNLRGAK